MADERSVSLPADLTAAVAKAAAWRGLTFDEYVKLVIGTASRLDAELAADIKEGQDDLDAGRFHTQEEVEAMFDVRREERNAA